MDVYLLVSTKFEREPPLKSFGWKRFFERFSCHIIDCIHVFSPREIERESRRCEFKFSGFASESRRFNCSDKPHWQISRRCRLTENMFTASEITWCMIFLGIAESFFFPFQRALHFLATCAPVWTSTAGGRRRARRPFCGKKWKKSRAVLPAGWGWEGDGMVRSFSARFCGSFTNVY